MEKNQTKKCYNSFSCILSVLIIVFLIGAVAYDMVVSKPRINHSIDEIKVEVKNLNQKIDNTFYFVDAQKPRTATTDTTDIQ